jgi:hypothetical protein
MYRSLSGGSRRSSGSGRTSVAAYERQLRQQQRVNEINAQLALDKQLLDLCAVHTEPFPAEEPWSAPPPEPVDPNAIKRELKEEAVAGLSRFKLSERRQAKRVAAERLDAALAAESERRENERQSTQAELDQAWQALKANEPEAVLSMLEAAFEDNETPAAAVSCRGSRVDILMRWPTLDNIVPERKVDVTPSGNPTIKKRNQTERAEFYLWALASNALVTAKEALAVCPAIEEVGLAVVRQEPDPARGDEIVEPVFLGTIQRSQLEGVLWEDVKPIATLLELGTGRIGMKGKGANKTLYGLSVDDEDEVSLMKAVGDGLGARVPDGGVPGLSLPIRVVHGG